LLERFRNRVIYVAVQFAAFLGLIVSNPGQMPEKFAGRNHLSFSWESGYIALYWSIEIQTFLIVEDASLRQK
jgi:hypothetical protein